MPVCLANARVKLQPSHNHCGEVASKSPVSVDDTLGWRRRLAEQLDQTIGVGAAVCGWVTQDSPRRKKIVNKSRLVGEPFDGTEERLPTAPRVPADQLANREAPLWAVSSHASHAVGSDLQPNLLFSGGGHTAA